MRLQTKTKPTYWGAVGCVRASSGLALKFIYMKAGTQSSMEYHIAKREIYLIEYGVLRLGLRNGRGVNSSVLLKEGDSYEIEPGQMHMRMCVEDCCIAEACSVDSDDDTYIVFDGKSYQFQEG